jgi:hypothetical protein
MTMFANTGNLRQTFEQQGSPHEWQLSKTHIDPKERCGFQNSLRLCFYL